MKIVQPIRSMDKITEIGNYLREKNVRDYMLWRVGICSGLRISDILQLRVRDVRDKTYFVLREQKTGKPKRLKIQPNLVTELVTYMAGMQDDDFLFPSNKNGGEKPIQRMQAWRIINEACAKCGIAGEVGCHTMRKTFGYHFYNQFNDETGRALALLQEIFNHSSSYITLRYIGIVQDEIDDRMDVFDIGFVE